MIRLLLLVSSVCAAVFVANDESIFHICIHTHTLSLTFVLYLNKRKKETERESKREMCRRREAAMMSCCLVFFHPSFVFLLFLSTVFRCVVMERTSSHRFISPSLAHSSAQTNTHAHALAHQLLTPRKSVVYSVCI